MAISTKDTQNWINSDYDPYMDKRSHMEEMMRRQQAEQLKQMYGQLVQQSAPPPERQPDFMNKKLLIIKGA